MHQEKGVRYSIFRNNVRHPGQLDGKQQGLQMHVIQTHTGLYLGYACGVMELNAG